MDDEARLTQQRYVWLRLYGPARADALLLRLRARLAAEPGLDPAAAIRDLDPEEATPGDELTAARW